MGKKSQITLFIAISIVILLVFFIINSISSEEESVKIIIPDDFNAQIYKEEIHECITEEIEYIIDLILLQGGYYEIPESIRLDDYFDISPFTPYYILTENNYHRSREIIEKEIIDSINSEFEDEFICSDIFEDQESKFKYSKIDVTAEDIENKTLLKISILGKFNTYNQEIDMNYNYHILIDLHSFTDASKSITDQRIANGPYICIPCIGNIAESNNLNISYYELEDEEFDSITYVLKDDKYTFRFSHQLKRNEYKADFFALGNIDKQIIKTGEELMTRIPYIGEKRHIFTDSTLVQVEDGYLKGTFDEEDIGMHIITLTAIIDSGDLVSKSFILEVIENE
jgi:hypothetical protein